MKNILLILLLLSFSITFSLSAQGKLPSVSIKKTNGKYIEVEKILNPDGVTVISFWAMWCKPCILELETIMDSYEEWKKETGVNICAVSIDDPRSSSKLPSFVNGRGWEYDIYSDDEHKLKQALNVVSVPYTLVLNSKGEIVWKHAGYAPGGEEELYEVIKKYSKL